MKNRPFITGIIAAASPIPMFFVTILWSWFWGFGIGMGLLGSDNISGWVLTVGLLPLAISPLLGLVGLIHSFIKIKTKLSWLGIVLSLLCLAENFLMIYGMGYIGSRY